MVTHMLATILSHTIFFPPLCLCGLQSCKALNVDLPLTQVPLICLVLQPSPGESSYFFSYCSEIKLHTSLKHFRTKEKMVSKGLMAIWTFFDACLLAAGIVTIALSFVWRKQDILMNMVLSNADLTAGLILGIMLVVTFVFSVGAIVQRNHVTIGLVILNYLLILCSTGIIIIGTFVWVFTLQERENFHKEYSKVPSATRAFIQDKFSCCGYFNGSDLVESSTFCNPTQVSFINALDPNDVNNSQFFCVTPVTKFADVTLNLIFTTVYGFMAIVLGLLLATLCVINMRKEGERFKRIDAKRGGRGFV